MLRKLDKNQNSTLRKRRLSKTDLSQALRRPPRLNLQAKPNLPQREQLARLADRCQEQIEAGKQTEPGAEVAVVPIDVMHLDMIRIAVVTGLEMSRGDLVIVMLTNVLGYAISVIVIATATVTVTAMSEAGGQLAVVVADPLVDGTEIEIANVSEKGFDPGLEIAIMTAGGMIAAEIEIVSETIFDAVVDIRALLPVGAHVAVGRALVVKTEVEGMSGQSRDLDLEGADGHDLAELREPDDPHLFGVHRLGLLILTAMCLRPATAASPLDVGFGLRSVILELALERLIAICHHQSEKRNPLERQAKTKNSNLKPQQIILKS